MVKRPDSSDSPGSSPEPAAPPALPPMPPPPHPAVEGNGKAGAEGLASSNGSAAVGASGDGQDGQASPTAPPEGHAGKKVKKRGKPEEAKKPLRKPSAEGKGQPASNGAGSAIPPRATGGSAHGAAEPSAPPPVADSATDPGVELIAKPAGWGKPYRPTEDDRRKVQAMIGMVHLTLAETSLVMGVSSSTLKAHFGSDIAKARAATKAKGGMTLFRIAMTDGHPDQFKALKFWLQTRARYSTTVNVAVSAGDGLDPNAGQLADLRKLSLDELRQLDSIATSLDDQTDTQE